MRQLYYVIRTLLRGRGANLIKIISLGLGLTMSILLFARVAYELSFDSCYHDPERLHQVFSIWINNGERSEPNSLNLGPVAGAILENFPQEVEAATSTCEWVATKPLYNGSVKLEDAKIMADSLFFKTMGIEVLTGDPQELVNKDVIFLSERFARKIFDQQNPIGKTLLYNKEIPLTVKGVYASLPENTSLPCEGVISLPTMLSRGIGYYSWDGGDGYKTYIRFRPGADKAVVEARLDAMVQKYLPTYMAEKGVGYTVATKPIRDVYRQQDDVKRMVNIMTILGFAILFIATLNYVLISISSLAYRAKAVGVHKCSGASGGTVFSMFLLETGIIILLALAFMGLLLFNFRDFVEDTVSARLVSLFAPDRVWVPALTVLFLFLVGGVLPGRIFSRIPVSQVFRRYTEGKKGWKRPLLFVQFLGVSFIAGLMVVVVVQYDYVTHKDPGYHPQRVALASLEFDAENSDYALTYFKGLPYVEAVSAADDHPAQYLSGERVTEGGKTFFSTRYLWCMENYADMMGMKWKQGRMPREKGEVAVNETFVQMMHWGNDVLGRVIELDGERYTVSGLLKDFRTASFFVEQQPFAMHYEKHLNYCIQLRLKEPFAENLQKLNKEASETFADKAVDFRSMEQLMTQSYNPVRVFRNATLLAAITMVFVMLMGLIGYTSDEVRRRSKEIAIRKVNGAESESILRLLSKDVLVVALPAVLIGSIGSWYVNGMWMELFAEKIEISWAVYVLVALAILLIIVGCVIWKSWHIANENPVNSIKSE